MAGHRCLRRPASEPYRSQGGKCGRRSSRETMRIAYLVSRYPAVSHTFVLREVLALRRLGLLIDTFSVRRSRPEELLSTADREAFETTYAILPPRIGDLLRAHAIALLTRPSRYVVTLWLALRLTPGGLRGTLWQLFYFIEAVIFWHECRRRGIRHVHAHFANVAADVALLAASLGGGGADGWSWSFTMHGSSEFYDAAQNRLAKKVERASFVVCISDFCRSQLMALADEDHWPKLRKARCGVDVDAYRPGSTESDDSAGATPGTARILCVGRLTSAKGQALLIRAVAELSRRRLPVEAVFVGDGPTRAILQELAQSLGIGERVVFTGSVGQDTIRSQYAAADLFCLPSLAEGVPVVLMEAMAMGLPVVTTRIMGTPELVDDGVSGLLVSPGRVDELARALAELISAPDRREAMGRAGREKVCAEFEIEQSARRVHELFVDELSAATARPIDARMRDRRLRAMPTSES